MRRRKHGELIIIVAGAGGKSETARRSSALILLYSLLLTLGLILGAPFWLVRMATTGRYRAGLGQRLGMVPPALSHAVRGRRTIWLHAVSVGEVLAAERLIAELSAALPDHVIAISTTTATGQAVAQDRLKAHPVFFMPLDFAFAVRSYLRVLRPELLLLVESELWPRLLHECARAGVPVAVVNARMSDRSFRRTRPFPGVWQQMATHVTLFLAQGAETAERLRLLGVAPDRILTAGNLKYDAPAGEPDPAPQNTMVRRLIPHLATARLVVCGSTLPEEEATLLVAWSAVLQRAPEAILLLAPRHPERFDEVERLIVAAHYPCQRCSRLLAEMPALSGSVLLLDTLGDLAAVYGLADVAFLGGSLVPKGGHNPLEAARFGVPVLMGGSYENFREIVEQMMRAKAITIVDERTLPAAILDALSRGRSEEPFTGPTGATARTLEALLKLLPEPR